jgi:[ribosomal protein S5]-alanine N-acetyltransferase
MRLLTERLLLRPFSEKDVDDLMVGINDIEVSKWLLLVPHPYKIKDAKWWINHCKESAKKRDKTSYEFALEDKADGKLIGAIGLAGIDRFQGSASVGYWVAKKYWRCGYASEALEAIIDLAFKKLKLRRIEASVFDGNPGSGKLLKKFGFDKEGVKKQAKRSRANGKIHDEIIYGLLARNYRKPKRRI